MSPVLWLLLELIFAIPLVYFLRRRVWGGLLAAVVAFWAANAMSQLSPGPVTEFLGRALNLNQFSQAVLTLLFLNSALLFLISAMTPSFIEEKSKRILLGKLTPKAHGGVQGEEGRTFYPVTLAVLALCVVAVLFRHLGIIAMIMQAAAILTVFIIQGGRLVSVRAALRFLLLISLATPMFLLAAWQIDAYQSKQILLISAADWQRIMGLIGLGFTIWLAVVPFHSWLTTIATDCYPPSATFVLLTFPMVALAVLVNLLADFPYPLDPTQLTPIILLAGIFTAVVGGGLASIQRGFSQLMGYAALYDLGSLVVILAVGHSPNLILVSFIGRALALILLAASTSAMRSRHAHDGFAELRGIAPKMPIASLGLLLGGLTLAGAPLTAGFISHWAGWVAVTAVDKRATVLLMGATLGVVIGYLRGGYALMNYEPSTVTIEFQEPKWLLLIITILGLMSLLLALYPAWLIEATRPWSAGIFWPL